MASLFDVLDNPPPVIAEDVRFDGHAYEHAKDQPRLKGQLDAILALMKDGRWRTVQEIAAVVPNAPESSVSAQLRNLRKPRMGGYTVERRWRGGGALSEYRLVDHS